MFKTAKLYSLLLILVVSTVVGLFGFSEAVSAQEATGDVPADAVARWSDGSPIPGTDGSGLMLFVGEDNIQTTLCQGGAPFYPLATEDVAERFPSLRDKPVVFSCPTSPGTPNRVLYLEDLSAYETDNPPVTYAEFDVGVLIPGSEIVIGSSGTPDPDNIADATGDNEGEEAPPSCQIKGIGWLICPVFTFLAEVTDASYWFLDRTLLKLEPIALPGSGADDARMQLYDSWRVMRDFANILFIIAFLIIVFSQITSFGISNYGIKRLLPKIVIAAILVNLSYFICAIAVDISNILGNELRGLLMPDGAVLPEFEGEYEGVRFDSTGWTGIAGVILGAVASAAIVYAFLPFFLPLLASAALAVVMVVIVLTLRQALVVMLIVISPLAFVALLLPNTESYFQKWRSLFTAMLLVYPIISVVFGASALASNILMTATNDFWMQLVGAGVAIIPLAITPVIMKASGGLLNRWAGIVNDPTKGVFDRSRNALDEQGKIIAAKRRGRSVERVGGFVSSNGNRGSRLLLGGANSRRRNALAFPTSYGEKARKDNLEAAESGVEESYLGTESGQETRNAAKNAQISLQNAQVNAETLRVSSVEGMDLQRESTNLETKKQVAETKAQTAAISAIPTSLAVQSKEAELGKQVAENTSKVAGLAGANTELKLRAATSGEQVSTAENKDRQTFEEIAAAGSSHPNLSALGVSRAVADSAQGARFEAKAVDSATSTAKSEGETNYSRALASDPSLLRQASGNVNREKGQLQAEARAAAVINKEEDEAVDKTVILMKSRAKPGEEITNAVKDLEKANDAGDVVSSRAAAKILASSGTKGNTALDETIERIEAAGKADDNVFANLKADLKGSKSTNVARDRWTTAQADPSTGKYRPLKDFQVNPDNIASLNEQELAGQQMNVLKAAAASGSKVFDDPKVLALVRRTIEQSDNGTIKLDTDKRALLENELAKRPPAPTYGPPVPPSPPPADPSMRASNI